MSCSVTDLRDDLTVFVQLLRAARVAVGSDQAITFIQAMSALSPAFTRDDLYWAGRATLVAHHEDLPTYDAVFNAWFLDPSSGTLSRDSLREPHSDTSDDEQAGAPAEALPDADHTAVSLADSSPKVVREPRTHMAKEAEPHVASAGGSGGEQETDEVAGGIASAIEALRRRRFTEATEDELRAIQDLMGNIVVTVPHRRSRRTRPARRGPVLDVRRTIRSAVQTDGELLRRSWRRRRVRPRRLVLVLDVSGSMAGHSRALLHFAYTARVDTRDVEVFCFGTRLTRLTEELGSRDVDIALAAAAVRVTDWDGGTLIGQSLGILNRSYGRLLRGAVVVVCSDGLERGDPRQVGEEMARIARYAYRVVWVNPLKADERYEPLARGMAAALPYLDRFLTGHDLASLEELAGALRGL